MNKPHKVFCIGFQKTGTTSLFAALSILDYRVCGSVCYDWELDRLRREGLSHCISKMSEFDAAEDMPWPIYYQALDKAFPGSKFILTLRDSENWFHSLDNHFGEVETPLSALTYGTEHMRARGNKDHYIQRFERHTHDVRAYFEDRPNDLLEMNFQNGDGWDALCPFLGADTPAEPFPVKNTSATRKSLKYRLKRKFLLLTGQTPGPEQLL